MAFASTTYPGGDSSTVTGSGPGFGVGGGGGFGGMPDWLMQALQSKIAQEQAMGQEQLKMSELARMAQQFQLDQARKGTRGQLQTHYMGDDNRNLRQAAERSALQAQMAQSDAMVRPAPQKMLFGPGIIPGMTMDPGAMSGAQRQMFLPQNSSFMGIPTPMDIERGARAEASGTQQAEMQGAKGLASYLSGSTPGFMPPSQGWMGPQAPMMRAQDQRDARLQDEEAQRRQRYGSIGGSGTSGGGSLR